MTDVCNRPGCDAPLEVAHHWRDGMPVCGDCFANATAEAFCECPPCPGRGNDGHGLTHCAECCFGTGVEADPDCPVHGLPACEGWTCQSCGADNFIPPGFARVITHHPRGPAMTDPGPGTWLDIKVRVVDLAVDVMVEALCAPGRISRWVKGRIARRRAA